LLNDTRGPLPEMLIRGHRSAGPNHLPPSYSPLLR